MSSLEDKKIFLIVSADEEKLKWLQETIEKRISRSTVYSATDGAMALAKVVNAPPHVLVTDINLPKATGLQLIDKILGPNDPKLTAVVIVGHPPEEERYLDELVTGRVQYLTNERDEKELMVCLMKALNYSSHTEKAEFYLKFLADGDVLLKEGEKADYVYFVKKGQLRAYKIIDGSECVLGQIDYGEFVGEMAYINGEMRSATVAAVSDCELIEVPIDTLGKVLFKRPAWSKALMLTLAKRVKAANEQKINTDLPEPEKI